MRGTPGAPNSEVTGWGRGRWSSATILRPTTEEQIRNVFQSPSARGVIPRGLGRSYGDAAQVAEGRLIETMAFSEIGSIDEGTGRVSIGAGVSLNTLLRFIVPKGWWVPVTPGTRFVTLGGALASDVHGKNHHREGGFASHVISFDLVAPSSTIREVTADKDPSTFWATAGGMGLTGVVTSLTLQLRRIETDRIRVDTQRFENIDALMAAMVEGDDRYRYSVAWVDLLTSGARLGRGVLTRGDHAPAATGNRRSLAAYDTKQALAVPPWFPGGVLRPVTARLFNALWFGKSPRQEVGRLWSANAFFYPLDAVRDWNRVYGRRGFLQYQFVVPTGEERVLRQIIERLVLANCPSFLAVLKRFGPEVGLLSFPLEGWTLAFDVPLGFAGLFPLLDGFDELVATAGGRVYLSKDLRLRPELLPIMYPKLGQWRVARSKLDPAGLLRSDLSTRLGLS